MKVSNRDSATRHRALPVSQNMESRFGLKEVLIYAVTTCVVIAIALPQLVQTQNQLHALLLSLYLAVCSVGIVNSILGGAKIVQLVYFGFSLSWSGLPVAYQLASDTPAWRDYTLYNNDMIVTKALLLHVAATAMVLLGCVVGGQRRKPPPALLLRDVDARAIPQVAAFLLVGTTCIAPFVIANAGGVASMFTSRDELKEQLKASGVVGNDGSQALLGILKILPGCLSLAAILLLIFYLRGQRASRKDATRSGANERNFAYGLALLAALFGIVFLNPFTNTRFIAAGAILCVLISITQPRGRKSGIALAGLVAFGLQLLYPLANMFRSAEAISEGPRFDPRGYSGPDYDGFQQLMNTILYVDEHGHSHGQHLISGILFFVPRTFWNDKAYPSSLDIAASRGYDFTNLSEPLHAELFLEFGALPMIVLMAMFGLLMSMFDLSWLKYPHSLGAIVAPYFAVALFGILRGPFGSLAPIYITTVCLIVGGCLLSNFVSRTSARMIQ